MLPYQRDARRRVDRILSDPNSPADKSVREIYGLLLAKPELIRSNSPDLPLDIIVSMTDITRMIVDGLAWGVLWAQDAYETSHIVAPFGYYKPDDVLEAQNHEPIRDALELLRTDEPPVESGPPDVDTIVETTGLDRDLADHLQQAVFFGVFFESAPIDSIRRPEPVAGDILRSLS